MLARHGRTEAKHPNQIQIGRCTAHRSTSLLSEQRGLCHDVQVQGTLSRIHRCPRPYLEGYQSQWKHQDFTAASSMGRYERACTGQNLGLGRWSTWSHRYRGCRTSARARTMLRLSLGLVRAITARIEVCLLVSGYREPEYRITSNALR